ncbi:RNA-directed DNA polymerase, eukaryota, reverse transcriptase zinc-binding domain protein [Tanacetum coccineum]|uniref:RNA-directed DNA polymerase, eukaryota, reverse transcriptase zinc-binding domain protein n=1 Tax=Tanacetum coccineum TaxID=301880 RepID=A0ABQ5CUY2_9ASTR
MGSQRTKKEVVQKISTSVFITNFPDSFSAKDLFKTCSQYGNVVDSYIPNKRSKTGKRFGFVHFLKVFNVERLVSNLCTLWVCRYRLHANIVRFQRTPLNKNNAHVMKKYEENKSNLNDHNNVKGVKDFANSYINVVKGGTQSMNVECSQPALVLDDSCFQNQDFSLSLIGKLRSKIFWIRVKEVSGWAPDFSDSNDDLSDSDTESIEIKSNDGFFDKDNEAEEIPKAEDNEVEEVEEPGEIKSFATKDSKKEDLEEVHSEDPFNIYDILEKKNQKPMLRVNQKWNQIHGSIEKEHGTKVDFKEEASYSETKIEQVELFDIRSCWGNLTFEFVVGPLVGNSGGILCVWDSNMLHKENHTISDYFIAIMGKWLPNDKNLLIISVYAPQELSEKKMLWQYLVHVIEVWNGDVIVTGDFNELRTADERFGSIFNVRGAAAFNSFISTGGLVEVPSGGYSYTWSHKSAAKISKLDCFLISEDLMSNCPNISSIILDRYLSDHRTILLRELRLDYGPTPFPCKKLKILKGLIRSWVKDKKDKAYILKNSLKKKIADIDSLLDNGEASSLTLEDRSNVMNNLINLERMKSIELAQKAKIQWSIDGDENLKNFHGIINKNRNNLAIRGITVDGKNRLLLDMIFQNKLSTDQSSDLERPFSTEEIKGVVWDCGLNKYPGPDGFTFDFYRKFCSLLEEDVVADVNHFFLHGYCQKGGQWSESNLYTIIHVLDCFFRASGLHINLHKSKLIGIAVDSSLVDDAANKIGCMDINLPFSYLGINIGGRLTLLKAMLGLTPLYYMSMFKVPIQVLKKLESICCHFFNGVDPNVRKMTFVKWNNVLASKEKGGLGVPSFYGVIKALHGADGALGSKPCYSSNWSEITQIIHSFQNKGIDLLGYMQKKLGNCEHTMFWEDSWKGEVPLKNLFPRIYSLEIDKSISVASKLAHSSVCFSLRRIPRGGIKHVQMEGLHSYLDGTILSGMLDRWRWTLSSDGEFLVSSIRCFIDDKTLATVGPKTRWNKYVPSKVNILAWRIKHDFLPMCLNISRRGIELDFITCVSCNSATVTTSHLFFSCPLVNLLYKNIARWWDVIMPEMSSYEEWWAWISALRFESKKKKISGGVFYITWWLLWNFRNKTIFGPTLQPKAWLFDDILAFSFTWCRSRCKANFCWVDWLKNPSLISL